MMKPSLAVRFKWWVFEMEMRWINRPRLSDAPAWFAQKRDRLLGRRLLATRVIMFGDGFGGRYCQEHMLCIARGWSRWDDTGVIIKISGCNTPGAERQESITYHFAGEEYASEHEALAAYERNAA